MSLLDLEKIHKINNLEITGVAHFGAHLGQEVRFYKLLNYSNIHLFEPQKEIYKLLKKSFSDDKDIQIYNIGLGSEDTSKELYLSPSNFGESASVLKPTGHLDYHPEIEFKNTEIIKIKPYDDFELKKVNYLNIDVQGYELDALIGSQNSLKKYVEYIHIEISRKEMYQDSVLKDELDNYLKNFGFIRVHTRWASSKIPWGDAFYIKKNKISRLKIILLIIKKFFENFRIYYYFIDPYRSFMSWKYKKKQIIKKYINSNNN